MIRLNVKREASFIAGRLQVDNRNKIAKATIRALNRAIDKAQTEANKAIRERYNLKARSVRQAFQKIRAHRNQAVYAAELRVSGAPIRLVEFGARWSGMKQPVGATVQVLKGGPRKAVRTAFIATMKSGHRGVFVRSGRMGRNRNPRAERISELVGISIPRAFAARVVREATGKAAREMFGRTFEQQLKFLSGA